MVNLPFVRGLSTRRLILLATAANLAVAAVVVGVPQSFVPAASIAYAAEANTAPAAGSACKFTRSPPQSPMASA